MVNPSTHVDLPAKLDTGSTFCIFARSYSDLLGLDLYAGPAQREARPRMLHLTHLPQWDLRARSRPAFQGLRLFRFSDASGSPAGRRTRSVRSVQGPHGPAPMPQTLKSGSATSFAHRSLANESPGGRNSKVELGRQLDEAGRLGAHNVAEGGAADVAVDGGRAEELGVVGGIEGFQAQFEPSRFAQVKVFQ